MKTYMVNIVILILLLTSSCAGWSVGIKYFGERVDRVSIPFYAEVTIHGERKLSKPINLKHCIWYRDPEHYRLELVDSPVENVTSYGIRSGDCLYITSSTMNHPTEPKWGVCPAVWFDLDMLDSFITSHKGMRDARLVGLERIHCIPVEHWRGHTVGKYSTKKSVIEIWQSVDEQFPLILKIRTQTPRSIMQYDMPQLQVGKPFSDIMFTPQVHPSSGFLTLIRMRFKPLWLIISWYIITILAFACMVFTWVIPKPGMGKVLFITVSSLLVFVMLCIPTDMSAYINQFSGLPVFILMALLLTAVLVYCNRKMAIPGDVKLFAATRWPVIIWVFVAIGAGLVNGSSRSHAMIANLFGTASWQLPFLPQTLIAVIVYAATWAALEEVVFRGYLTGLLGNRFTSLRLVNVLQALIFTVEHIPKFMNEYRSDPFIFTGLVGIFIFGLIFGGLRLKYRNLGAPWIVHTAYNIGFYYAAFAGTHSIIAAISHIY